MPDMDGRTLLALMRVSSASANVPVLIVTATVSPGLERELEQEGAEAVISKSWGAELIVEYVESLLHRA
jgi:CheY-like chemotaxis protein